MLCPNTKFLTLPLIEYISVAAVTATYGFALTARHFWQTPQKYPKGLAPSVRPLAPVSIWGHRPTVGFASTYMRWVRLRRTALRANPQMNTCAQPPEGAGESRSKAAGELALDLLSGEGQRCTPLHRRSEACPRRRPDSRPIHSGCTQTYVGAAVSGVGCGAQCLPRSVFECLMDVSERRPFPRIFQVVRRKRTL
jgi:hypothetical protein